jgi:hypothetical protein
LHRSIVFFAGYREEQQGCEKENGERRTENGETSPQEREIVVVKKFCFHNTIVLKIYNS